MTFIIIKLLNTNMFYYKPKKKKSPSWVDIVCSNICDWTGCENIVLSEKHKLCSECKNHIEICEKEKKAEKDYRYNLQIDIMFE